MLAEQCGRRKRKRRHRNVDEHTLDLRFTDRTLQTLPCLTELALRGMKAAVEQSICEFDSELVQAVQREERHWSNDQRPYPLGLIQRLLQVLEHLVQRYEGYRD